MSDLPFLLLCFCFFLLGIKVHKDWIDANNKWDEKHERGKKMKLIIDIPEDVIESAKSSPNYYPTYYFEKIWKAIVNGTPLPEGHGRLIDINEITAFRELECNGHNVESLDEFTTIIEADKESEDKE